MPGRRQVDESTVVQVLLIRVDTPSNMFFFFILYTLLFIFLTSARKQLQHLLENNQLLYSLYCYIFKRSTLWTSIQTNMLELPGERPLSGTEGPNVPQFFVGDEGFALNRNVPSQC